MLDKLEVPRFGICPKTLLSPCAVAPGNADADFSHCVGRKIREHFPSMLCPRTAKHGGRIASLTDYQTYK